MKKWLLVFCGLLCFSVTAAPCKWPEWESFKKNYISKGRVVDGWDKRKITTSEGQSYALFFALIANDKHTFEQLLSWTEDNLAARDLTARLPAWLWDPEQGIIDQNSASDSDFWIAYTLLEAGRKWADPYYSNVGYLLANRILKEEVITINGQESQLLPGKQGFTSDQGLKLNPSYLPLQLIDYFTDAFPGQGWEALQLGNEKLLYQSIQHGFSPDWIMYKKDKFSAFKDDTGKVKHIGSYNAIRSYLWVGMLNDQHPQYEKLNKHFQAFANITIKQGFPPEKINLINSQVTGKGNAGFSAASVPLLMALGEDKQAESQYQRALPILNRKGNKDYYSTVLTLFASAWYEQRYKFNLQGSLNLPWGTQCQNK